MLNNSPGDIVLEHHDRCRGRVNGVCYQGVSEVVDEETDNVEFDNMGSVLLKKWRNNLFAFVHVDYWISLNSINGTWIVHKI